ncbi:MAG: D-alanine--D-alanine ligase [Planctomycetes bacterium]|nr:D-alanine--D-alanine ligase [Planctomycetota bacterium]
MRTMVLHNAVEECARNDDADVLTQRDTVSKALSQLGHEVLTFPCTSELSALKTAIADFHPDFAFNLVESLDGYGRLLAVVPGLLEALRIPFTGSSSAALFLTSHKTMAKRWLRSAGLPTPAWFACGENSGQSFSPGSYIIKSIWEHASLGLSAESIRTADSQAELLSAVRQARATEIGDCFAEQFIAGREFNLSLLDSPSGPEVLPAAEIEFIGYHPEMPKIVDYRAKWDEGSYEYHHTPRRFDFIAKDQPLLDKLNNLALAAWHAFGLGGYARVDFRVDSVGKPWILEVNANPCLSPDAGFMAAAERSGLDCNEVVGRILGSCHEPFFNRPPSCHGILQNT